MESYCLSPFQHQLVLKDLQVIQCTARSTKHLAHITSHYADCPLRWRLPLTATGCLLRMYHLLKWFTKIFIHIRCVGGWIGGVK
jgi:hypothetical protein